MSKAQTLFEKDLERKIDFNGKPMSQAYYNLVVSIRDVKLYRHGMKPHLHWRITDVKKYFGLKGNDKDSLIEQLYALKTKHFPEKI